MHKYKSLNIKLINTLFCSSIRLKKVGASYKCIPCHCKKMEQDRIKNDSNSESDSESELTVLKTLNEKTKDLWTASIDISKEKIITLENSSNKDISIRKETKLSKSDISIRKKPKLKKSDYYYKCAFCVEELKDAKTLKIHIESKHSEDLFKFPCDDCEFNAEGPRFLKKHQHEKKHGPYKKEKTIETENVKNHAKINENQVKPFDEHFQFNNQNDKNVLCNKKPKIFEDSDKEEYNENQVKPFDKHLQYNNQNDKKQKDNIEIIRDASEFPTIELVKNLKDDLHFFTYKCKPCDKPFQEMCYATDHFNDRHVCSYCHKIFHKTTVLQDHVKKDHQNSNLDVSNSQAGSSNVINEKNILDKKNTQVFQNIKDKNYRGLLNRTKSNIPKEKEIEVITLEGDYEPEDYDESIIDRVKLRKRKKHCYYK